VIVLAVIVTLAAESTPAAVVIAIVGTGGIIGGLVALLKVRPETGKLIVEAAEGAVVVQAGVMRELRAEIEALRELEARASKRELDATKREQDLRRELEDLRSELDRCTSGLGRLRARLASAGFNGDDDDGIAVE
jgi:chromosome segregation ATPase